MYRDIVNSFDLSSLLVAVAFTQPSYSCQPNNSIYQRYHKQAKRQQLVGKENRKNSITIRYNYHV